MYSLSFRYRGVWLLVYDMVLQVYVHAEHAELGHNQTCFHQANIHVAIMTIKTEHTLKQMSLFFTWCYIMYMLTFIFCYAGMHFCENTYGTHITLISAISRKPCANAIKYMLYWWQMIWAATWENRSFAYAKTKTQISFGGDREADQRLCFATWIVQSLCFLNPISSLAIFCGCTARFVSDLVGNPEDRFSDVAAHMSHVMIKPVLLHMWKQRRRWDAASYIVQLIAPYLIT